MTASVDQVFELWKARQKKPELCRNSAARRKLISDSLRDMTAEDLAVLFEFAYEADHRQARWWRGDNPQRRRYLRLEDLLRPTKLAPRVELALRWKAGDLDDEEEVWDGESDDDEDEDDLGPLGRMRRRQSSVRSLGRRKP